MIIGTRELLEHAERILWVANIALGEAHPQNLTPGPPKPIDIPPTPGPYADALAFRKWMAACEVWHRDPSLRGPDGPDGRPQFTADAMAAIDKRANAGIVGFYSVSEE